MFKKLDKYNLNLITEYLFPFEKFNLLLSCKNINNEMKGFKHILQLNINHNNRFDFENFLYLYSSCKKLKIFNIYRICDPHIWLNVEWVNCVYMHYCRFSSIINPPLSLKTESLHIYNSKESNIEINWIKFPNLKSLYLDCYDIDLKGIEKCKNLEIIFIQAKNECIKDINNIGSLTKLRYFISNFKVQTFTKFWSQDLKHCVIEKYDKLENKILFNCDNVNTKKYFYNIELDFSNLYKDKF